MYPMPYSIYWKTINMIKDESEMKMTSIIVNTVWLQVVQIVLDLYKLIEMFDKSDPYVY